MKRSYVMLLILAILAMQACAPPLKKLNSGPYEMQKTNYSIVIPAGWKAYQYKDLWTSMTRESIVLQKIIVQRLPVDMKWPETKRTLNKDMLPQEAAEVVIDAMKSSKHITHFSVLSNEPAQIDGFSGFRLSYQFRSQDSVNDKVVMYLFIHGDYFYKILYSATQRHYFDRDLETFEGVKNSFRLLSH